MELQKHLLNYGFILPSAEIYGGSRGFYDYGSYGFLLKKRIEEKWRKYFLNLIENCWEISPSEIMPKNVFEASGHLRLFTDPITKCKKCGEVYRADKLIEEFLGIKADSLSTLEMERIFQEGKVLCPKCSSKLESPRKFNLMFSVFMGPKLASIIRDLLKSIEDPRRINTEVIQKISEEYQKVKEDIHFLRPETAQGPYLCFPRMFVVHREKLPIGLAAIGKAFRNEISPRKMLIRLREFTQAELQIFFEREEWGDESFTKQFDWEKIKNEKINILPVKYRERGKEYFSLTLEEIRKELKLPIFYVYFMYKTYLFLINELSIPKERIRLYELAPEEKAFYNKYHFDFEIYFNSFKSWEEVAGIHYRAVQITEDYIKKAKSREVKEFLERHLGEEVGYDLLNHLVHSGESKYIVKKRNKEFIPVELEISFGIDRLFLAILDIFFDEKERILRLPPDLAPITVAVFPLLESREEMVRKAKEVYLLIKDRFKCFFDASGSIGRRYKRQDSIGTPFCITIDYQTLEDNTVTIRFRDTKEQIRVKINELEEKISDLLR